MHIDNQEQQRLDIIPPSVTHIVMDIDAEKVAII